MGLFNTYIVEDGIFVTLESVFSLVCVIKQQLQLWEHAPL